MATTTTSRIMTYITQSTPKVNHQRCGEDRRHVLAELYNRIWTSTNQTSVKVEPINDNLNTITACVMCGTHAQRCKCQETGKQTSHRPAGMAWARLETAPRLNCSRFFVRRGRVSFHPEAHYSGDYVDELQHHWTRDHCCAHHV